MSSLTKLFGKYVGNINNVLKMRASTITVGNLRKSQTEQRISSLASCVWRNMMKDSGGTKRIVGHWLIASSGLVFGIVVLGGVTRLTESGLSMVDWSLLHFKAPQSQIEWEQYFAKYQESPEFKINNRDMTVEEFKSIYWYEHAHRVYGRLLGMFIILPATFFVAKKWASPGMRKLLLGCSGLVVFQGLLGWYMVKSGLRQEIIENREQPRVSPYRLAAHLGSAFILYLTTLAAGFRILGPKSQLHLLKRTPSTLSQLVRVNLWTHRLAGMTFLTAMTGAFVAGLDAGMIYNSFPFMGDRLVPNDIWDSKHSWKNITENPTTVQFIHRCMAITTVTGISVLWIASRRLPLPKTAKNAMNMVMAAAWAQGSLGVLTLIYMVPIPIASAHQGGSLVLLSSFIWLANVLKRIPK